MRGTSRSICAASRVQSEAPSPNFESLAISTAWSAEPARMTTATGPKSSSRAATLLVFTSARMETG